MQVLWQTVARDALQGWEQGVHCKPGVGSIPESSLRILGRPWLKVTPSTLGGQQILQTHTQTVLLELSKVTWLSWKAGVAACVFSPLSGLGFASGFLCLCWCPRFMQHPLGSLCKLSQMPLSRKAWECPMGPHEY